MSRTQVRTVQDGGCPGRRLVQATPLPGSSRVGLGIGLGGRGAGVLCAGGTTSASARGCGRGGRAGVLRCWVPVVESGPCNGMGRRRPALAVKRVSRKVVGRYRGREMDVRGSLCGLKERGGVCVALLRLL